MKEKLPGLRLHGATALLIALCAALFLCAAAAETKLMVVSDLHYLEPSLYQGSELFLQALRRGDGKITQYGEELMSALQKEIFAERPDALIVTGDLTFNGEKQSHAALADWFANVEAAGIPVWVIPGNHDINSPTPIGYASGLYYGVEGVTPETFAEIYAHCTEKGMAGFSYLAKVSDRLWVAMTDVSYYEEQAQTFGLFTARHATWLEGALREARQAGVTVITATHHNLIAHTEYGKESYLMFGSENMRALTEKYGVPLNLCGHLHIQHIAGEEGLADAALGAFCIYPHRYAVVTLSDDGALTYDARALSEQFLPEGFSDRSREWYLTVASDKLKPSLTGTTEEIELMADYAARFNLAYFSGTFHGEDLVWTEDPAYALWEKQPNASFLNYMKLVMREASGSHLHLELSADKP